ncbi:MAG: YchJ family metal-binding protein [Corynebacterium sp.]|nr:YchJ family metal-binding protein [Corynebacterium sp.]
MDRLAPHDPQMPCYCNSGRTFLDCCHRFLSGRVYPGVPEALMRARYSAYVVGDAEFIRSTWSERTRPDVVHLDPTVTYTRLEVHSTIGGPFDVEGKVHFTAYYEVHLPHQDLSKEPPEKYSMTEFSIFDRDPVTNRWQYLEGEVSEKRL